MFDRLTEYLDSLGENHGVPYFELWRITQRTGVWTAIAKRVTNGAISPIRFMTFIRLQNHFCCGGDAVCPAGKIR